MILAEVGTGRIEEFEYDIERKGNLKVTESEAGEFQHRILCTGILAAVGVDQTGGGTVIRAKRSLTPRCLRQPDVSATLLGRLISFIER